MAIKAVQMTIKKYVIMKKIVVFAVLLNLNFLQAQWISMPLSDFRDEILKVEQQLSQKSSMSYFADLFIFSSHTGQDTMVSSTSEYFYNAKTKLLNFSHLGDFIVQDANFQVICDTASKYIMLLDANPIYVSQKQLIDFDMLLKSDCRAMKMPLPDDGMAFKLIFPQGYIFESAELYFDAKMQMEKYVLYSTQNMSDDRDWQNVHMVKPRMEIVVRNYAFDKAVEKRKFRTVSDFIKDIDKLVLTEAYKNYELLDMRTIKLN